MFGLMILMVTVGLVMTGLSGSMPIMSLRIMMFIVGVLVAFIGIIILFTRAVRTGAIHILAPAVPDEMLWFYLLKEGTIKITPAFRRIEGMMENKEIGYSQDMKAYRLLDHNVRFIPEDIGHSVDVRHCLYAKVLKNKYGFEGIKDARRKLLFHIRKQEPEFMKKEGE